MASINKRGKFWQAQICRRGIRKSATFDTKAEAEIWASTIESEIGRSTYIDRTPSEKHSLADLIDRYIKEVTPQKKSGRNQNQHLKFLRSELGHHRLAALQSKDVASFRDKRLRAGKAPATVIKELNLLSHVIDTSIKDWGIWVSSNPVKHVKRPAPGRGRNRRLSKAEETCVLAACRESRNTDLETLVALAIETGMRLGELLAVDWKHINLKRRTAYLPSTKTGDDRAVPLSPKAVQLLKSIKPKRTRKKEADTEVADTRVFLAWKRADSFEHLWRRTINKALADYVEQCKEKRKKLVEGFLEDLRFHDLRHEATTRFFERGLNPMEVAAITGHKTLQMLKRYTHLRAEDIAKKL